MIKSLTILPKKAIPKMMPVTMARKTARTRVNLNARKKRGIRTIQSTIVRQPVAKSFASNMGQSLLRSILLTDTNEDYNRSRLMKKGRGSTTGVMFCVLISG